MCTVSAGAIAALAATSLGAAPVSASPDPIVKHRSDRTVPDRATGAGSLRLGTQRVAAGDRVDQALRAAKGPVDVMIELDAAPATAAFGQARGRGLAAARTAGRVQASTVKAAQRGVESRFGAAATQARTLYRLHTAYAGIAVRTDASRLGSLAAIPGVKAIHRLTPKQPSNTSSVPLIGATKAWQALGETGKGVRIGIIDTGIDYTHADFGGPGTVEAFKAAGASNTFTPTAKVVGGYDFAGDAYNADPSSDTFDPVPHPDANPLDCNGHGSHVAGTAAGLGVAADGTTWSGGYTEDIDPTRLEIGPGVAPEASLYALKVFGCDGSTDVVGQALDWAADPNGDGDLSDHLDVVNMSLGSSYGSPQDPDAVAANNLAALGTVVVASMGNSGDVYEVGGSPGNAPRVLAVAASDDGNDVVDGLKVDSPAGIEPADTVDGTQDDVFGALKSSDYDWKGQPGVTDTAVAAVGDWSTPASATNNTDGCDPYSSADAARIAGKVVLEMWLDGNGRRCGSIARGTNAQAAGAAGIIYGSDTNAFSAGVSGSKVLPAMLVVNQATRAVKARLDADAEVRVTMTDALRKSVTIRNPKAVDQLAGFSSRGVGVAGDVKPDVAAPGVTTFSVAVGTGHEGVSESGTSMASPHVAGEAALVRGSHPTWSVEEVKAAIMNTATQDVFVGPDHTGGVYGPERVGAGRVVADAAVATDTLAYVADDPGAVSVSFGPVAVTTPTKTLTKTVRVVNKRPLRDVSYVLSYAPAHPTPGVTYAFSPSQVRVPAGGTVDVKVTATFTRSALRAVTDPTTATDPLALGIARSYRTDASGRMVLEPVEGTPDGPLRVPVWSAPRPASTMSSPSSTTVVHKAGLPAGVATSMLPLMGGGLDQGSGSTSYASSVSTFQLQGVSPRLPTCSPSQVVSCVGTPDDRGADLRYVGAASDAPLVAGLDQATLSFGISTHGPWRTPASSTEFDVFLDTNADGTADAMVYNTRISGTDDEDYFASELVDLRPGAGYGKVLDDVLVNGIDGSFDTNLFDSDSLAMPVSVKVLRQSGLVTGSAPRVRYWVGSLAQGVAVDTVGSAARPMTISLASPGLSAYGDFGTLTSTDLPGERLEVRRDDASAKVDQPMGLLLLHHLNTDGSRAAVVTVRTTSTTRLTASPTTFTQGGRTVLTAAVTPSSATGTVVFRKNGALLRTVAVSGGKAVLTVNGMPRGSVVFTATYSGDARLAGSTSAGVRVTVNGVASATSLRTSSTAYRYGARPTLTATVAPSSATGSVTFRDGTRVLGTSSVSQGRAVLRLPVLSRGTHSVTATYNGSTRYNPSTSSRVTLRVS
ncbi:S8 family serine peptidase [Terrabacter aerolatus]|uniref:Peptidase S8 n=1 Tax=Terrabacter aerolatus TaxID=422442 RepID=A0A512CXW0_9MICO|nr:S8 family serine peptidase [Terrabacter aerolatus]GEO29053.1 peptidase S8 [Terrabacter aerolatus]